MGNDLSKNRRNFREQISDFREQFRKPKEAFIRTETEKERSSSKVIKPPHDSTEKKTSPSSGPTIAPSSAPTVSPATAPSSAHKPTIVLTPTQDSYVQGGRHSNTNHGYAWSAGICVKTSDPNLTRKTIIDFALPSAYDFDLISATLMLKQHVSDHDWNVKVSRLHSTIWNKDTVTWNNLAPSVMATGTSVQGSKTDSGKVFNFDVTDLIAASASPTVTFFLEAIKQHVNVIFSNSASSSPPKLVIVYRTTAPPSISSVAPAKTKLVIAPEKNIKRTVPKKYSQSSDDPPPTPMFEKSLPSTDLKELNKQTASSKTTTSNIDLLESPLMGSVFVYDDRDGLDDKKGKVGHRSIHFEKKDGWYVSFSDAKLKDGAPLQPRIYFTEQEYNSHDREFKGVIDYGGEWDVWHDGNWHTCVSESHTLKFDTQFNCVLSGKLLYKSADGSVREKTYEKDISYTSTNLDNVDFNTVNRLKEEGASPMTTRPFIKEIRKQKERAETEKERVETEKKRSEYAAENYTYSTFEEMTKGYFYSTKWKRDEKGGYKDGEETTTWVDMSTSRESSYEKYNEEIGENDTISLLPAISDMSSPPPVEYRGITLRQLLAIVENIKRRCVAERWVNYKGEPLDKETVTLYDCNNYVILPFTKSAGQSLVSCLPSTAGPQPPRWFASHWWGEGVLNFVRCLERHMMDFARNGYREHGIYGDGSDDEDRGGGLTLDTPIWICAHSNNQHELSADITEDPKESGFTRAMNVAEGRTITILDEGGIVFSRIWCAYELYLTLVNERANEGSAKKAKEGVWAVYTANRHIGKSDWTGKEEEREAVGIISGGAPIDGGNAHYTSVRERHFPVQLIKKSLAINVETADSTEESDRIHILNSIRGNCGDGINDTPPKKDPKYNAVNDAVRAGFISTVPSIKAAAKETDNDWNKFLLALSKGGKELKMDFNFSEGCGFGEDGWDGLTADRATQLIKHLPLTIVELNVSHAEDKFGTPFIDAVSKHVSESSRLDKLWLSDISVGGEEGGKAAVRLVEAIDANNSLKEFYLGGETDLLGLNNLEEWGSILVKNNTLKKLVVVSGLKDRGEIISKLKEITKNRTPKLYVARH